MAKVNAPLFSFNASGQIAKALVYFGWKGIDVVRSYVVPTNPKSEDQRTQRGYLKSIVDLIHITQASINFTFNAADMTALALLGNTYPTPRTWFNQACKIAIDRLVAGKGCYLFSGGYTVAGDTELIVNIGEIQSHFDTGKFWYGTSPTALVHSVGTNITGYRIYATLPNLTNGTKYYWQIRTLTPDVQEGYRSGIYTGIPVKA